MNARRHQAESMNTLFCPVAPYSLDCYMIGIPRVCLHLEREVTYKKALNAVFARLFCELV